MSAGRFGWALLLAATLAAQVPYERIVNADREPGSWLTYSRDYLGQRFSPLDQITPANAGRLKVKWAYQFDVPNNEVSPIVADGVMYITGPNRAAALDLKTGRELWRWRRPIPSDYQNIGFGRVNRGPAILGDHLIFVATLDCYLVALDIKSGHERWSTQVADYKPGYSMTLAPLAYRDKVAVGISGGEAGIRGFVDAYDVKTGRRAWRFYTIQDRAEQGHESWKTDVANRREKFDLGDGRVRFRRESSVLGRGKSGAGLEWRPAAGRQFVHLFAGRAGWRHGKTALAFSIPPHDTHDWDAAHVPGCWLDAVIRGQKRRVVANANRNALLPVLDREERLDSSPGKARIRSRPGPRGWTIAAGRRPDSGDGA